MVDTSVTSCNVCGTVTQETAGSDGQWAFSPPMRHPRFVTKRLGKNFLCYTFLELSWGNYIIWFKNQFGNLEDYWSLAPAAWAGLEGALVGVEYQRTSQQWAQKYTEPDEMCNHTLDKAYDRTATPGMDLRRISIFLSSYHRSLCVFSICLLHGSNFVSPRKNLPKSGAQSCCILIIPCPYSFLMRTDTMCSMH